MSNSTASLAWPPSASSAHVAEWESKGEQTCAIVYGDSYEMLRRNVRVTPLPGLGDTDALDVVAALPEMCVFSSDYPHQEGNADPIALYQPGLDTLGANIKSSFLGENIANCYARMNDPLPSV